MEDNDPDDDDDDDIDSDDDSDTTVFKNQSRGYGAQALHSIQL